MGVVRIPERAGSCIFNVYKYGNNLFPRFLSYSRYSIIVSLAEMYDAWYEKHAGHIKDCHSTEWEIFGLKHESGNDMRLASATPILSQDAVVWVKDQRPILPTSKSCISQPELQILFTRHRDHDTCEIKPWFMSFDRVIFRSISEAMLLPSSYLWLRANAGGSGNFTKHSTFDDKGNVTSLAFIIRVPHSPRIDAKAIWSIAVSWNAATGMTSGLFEGMSNADIDTVTSYTSARINQTSHPLFFPSMLLDVLTSLYVQHRRGLERDLFILEDPTGIARGPRITNAWNWDADLYRDTTTHCCTIFTRLVYLERGLDFTVKLADFILECLKLCSDLQVFPDPNQQKKFEQVGREIKESILNSRNFASTQLHQTICLQKRAQALTTVIYTIVTQQDSQTNVKIAKAAKKDSTSMTAIAFLGIIFLPATLIATIFSMSMFDLSFLSTTTPSSPSSSTTPPPPSTATSIVTHNFWMYWVVTIPLTLCVLLSWKLWMWQNKKWEDACCEMPERKQRVVEYQAKVNESMDLDTPFYPGKGGPTHMLWVPDEIV